LRVGQSSARLHRKPKVAKPISKLALAIHIAIIIGRELICIKTVAHHNGVGRLLYGFEKQR